MDPNTRALVDLMATNFPKVGTEVVDAVEVRQLLEAAPRPAPPDVPLRRIENFTIPGPDGAPELAVRGYWPDAEPGNLPVVVFLHGGGFAICDLDSHDAICRRLAAGISAVVVSVDYRRAPEAKCPVAAEDGYAAVVWTAGHAAELGADPARLAVAGDSAGGNLAAVTALIARDRGGPPIAAQLLIYPVIDAGQDTQSYRDNAEHYFLTAVHMRWYWDQYLPEGDDGSHPYASPIRAETHAGLPPAVVVTGGYDPLRDEGNAYAAKLQESDIPAQLFQYDDMFHGFFGMVDALPTAARANEDVYAAMRSLLDA